MRTIHIHKMSALSALLVTTAMSTAMSTAAAQEEAGPDVEARLNAIVVTASRRESALQDLSQAVSALPAGVIEKLHAVGVQDLAGQVPSVDLQYFGPGRSRVTVRGISPDEQTGAGTVSYYVDEIAITSSSQVAQPDVYLYDTQRVEFLRGPQGTLYGEGAMGGTIRVITNTPDTDKFGGSARASVFSVKNGGEGYNADAAINIPIVKDIFAVRVAGGYREEPGWIDFTPQQIQLFTPPPARYVPGETIKNANTSEATNFRLRALLTPNDKFSADFSYLYGKSDARTTNVASDGNSHRDFMLRPSSDKSEQFGLTLSYDFGGFELISATSFGKRQYGRLDPNEPFLTVADPLDPTVLNNYVDLYWTDQFTDGDVTTQEIRLVSDADRALRWTIGAYYREGSGSQQVNINYVSTLLGEALTTIYDYFSKSKGSAIFGEVEYDFTDVWTLAVGARWFTEEETGPTHIDGMPFEALKRDADDVTPRVTLTYKPNDAWLAYATYSTGYRTGGFNRFGSTLGVSTDFKPDKTNNYELGVKYSSPDGRLNAGGNIFYIDWSDLQFIQLDPATSFTYVGNANKAASSGLELEFAYQATEQFYISGSASLTDARTESDIHGNMTGLIRSGTSLPSVPDYRFSLYANYDIPLESDLVWSLALGLNGVGDSESKLEKGGTFVSGFGDAYVIGGSLDGYILANASATLQGDSWAMSLFMRNLTDERAQLGNDNYFPAFGQPLYYSPPRTVGIELSKKF